MKKAERQAKIKDAVRAIVAEKGMDGFSIRQAAERTNINEALIYRDFGTKDQLLDICYQNVQDEIAEIYTVLGPLDLSTPELTYVAMKDMWMKSFQYLLDHKENALFIRNYRESSYREKLLISGQQRKPKYFFEARDKFALVLPKGIDIRCAWIYILDVSLEFAVHMLKGELESDPEHIQLTWEIMFEGLKGQRTSA